MKKNAILFLILFSITGVTKLRAQKTVQEALSYYPLQVGNEWQYWYDYDYYPGTAPDSGYADVKVTGTVMIKHKKYQILTHRQYRQVDSQGTLKLEYTTTSYERVDSATANVYRYNPSGEELQDSLMIQKGDTIFTNGRAVFITCYNTASWHIFGDEYRVKRLSWFNGGISGDNHDLAKGIGIKYKDYSDENTYGNIDTLIYAQINGTTYGTRVKTPIEKAPQSNRPSTIQLHQNYPNPFNPTTTIRYELARPGPVRLTVYNVLGQRVTVLVDSRQTAGEHHVTFNASQLGSEVYFYRLRVDDKVLVGKMLLMK